MKSSCSELNANRGGGTMPAFLATVILSVLVLGAVGADYFAPTSDTPAQQIARASRKWCPPNPSMIRDPVPPAVF